MDIQGKLLLQKTGWYEAGYHEFSLNRAELGVASGLLSYTIVTGTHRESRKMLLMD